MWCGGVDIVSIEEWMFLKVFGRENVVGWGGNPPSKTLLCQRDGKTIYKDIQYTGVPTVLYIFRTQVLSCLLWFRAFLWLFSIGLFCEFQVLFFDVALLVGIVLSGLDMLMLRYSYTGSVELRTSKKRTKREALHLACWYWSLSTILNRETRQNLFVV